MKIYPSLTCISNLRVLLEMYRAVPVKLRTPISILNQPLSNSLVASLHNRVVEADEDMKTELDLDGILPEDGIAPTAENKGLIALDIQLRAAIATYISTPVALL